MLHEACRDPYPSRHTSSGTKVVTVLRNADAHDRRRWSVFPVIGEVRTATSNVYGRQHSVRRSRSAYYYCTREERRVQLVLATQRGVQSALLVDANADHRAECACAFACTCGVAENMYVVGSWRGPVSREEKSSTEVGAGARICCS